MTNQTILVSIELISHPIHYVNELKTEFLLIAHKKQNGKSPFIERNKLQFCTGTIQISMISQIQIIDVLGKGQLVVAISTLGSVLDLEGSRF